MSERALLERIAKIVGGRGTGVEIGIGDDAAVLMPPAGKLIATVDMVVEGVHFDRAWSDPEAIGHKALAVNLSDIAAMGAEPRYALVSLALPATLDEAWVERLYGGMQPLLERWRVAVVGGNLTRSPGPLAVDVTLLGETASPWLRAGARSGDLVAVTGSLGRAAAGLRCLRRWGRAYPRELAELIRAQVAPEPRLAEAAVLRAAGAVTAAIDVSDGLSTELGRLAERSGVGFAIDGDLPVAASVLEAARALGEEAVEWAWHGGEDYELLFTCRPEAAAAVAKTATVIGTVTAETGVVRRRGTVIEARGWDPFSGA